MMEKSAVAQFAQKQEKASGIRRLSEIGALWTGTNRSGIEPVGHAVLVLPYKPELESSPIFIPEEVSRQVDMYEMRGIVVAIGPDAWKDGTPRCSIGDKVMISKFCGAMLRGPADDVQYRMVNAGDIFARITEERILKESEDGR